jgi:uncharacterized protein (TIGR02996 family)
MIDADADFLRAIIDKPADDAPRLVYADWLDETGRSGWAEFIRVQCELAAQRDPAKRPAASEANDRRQDWLERRERELLLYERCKGWLPEGFTVGNDHFGPWGTNTREAVFRRGFVAEVRAPLAALVGGRCERCEGRGVVGLREAAPLPLGINCPACSVTGTGRTPGILRALVRAQPVTKVVATDKRPNRTYREDGGGECWCWWAPGNGPEVSRLPADVWSALIDRHGAFVVPRSRITVDDCDTEEEAAKALSDALLLRWAAAPHAATA